MEPAAAGTAARADGLQHRGGFIAALRTTAAAAQSLCHPERSEGSSVGNRVVIRSLRSFAGCALALASPSLGAEPVTVRDAFNRSVTVPAPPQRIIPIFASNTEIV